MANLEKLPITVVILSQNEEDNIGFAVASVLPGFSQIIVIDSYSTDSTSAICKRFSGIEFYQNKFVDWAAQRNWALHNCIFNNSIVFFMDADEYVTEKFVSELKGIIEAKDFASISLNVSYVFLGTNLRHAYGHPKIRRIFKRSGLVFLGAGARERAVSDGVAVQMKEPLIHHDKKPLSRWIERHNVNADREVVAYLAGGDLDIHESMPKDLQARIWIRQKVWNRLPLIFRPSLYFTYRYLFNLGFLDGKEGFIYCFLHAFWYQMLIDVKILEAKLRLTPSRRI